MSDQTSTLLLKLLSTGDFSALVRGKQESDALKVSVEALRATLGLLGTGFTVGAFIQGTKAAIEYGSAINDLSIQAGISTQAFQSLAYVAEAAGVKQEELGGSLNILARNLAQAADGASKQNRAIADLGLNTAELLAMPVEQQIEAIARAYVNASDKGKAWADVLALLGKNSAKVKEILQEVGAKGFAGIEKENPMIISDADIARLDSYGDYWAKLWRQAKTVSAEIVARPVDALMMLNSPAMGYAGFHAMGMSGGKPAETGGNVDQINAQLEATIKANPQMIAANQALYKALGELNKAYENPAEAAKRLRIEAEMAMRQAEEFAKQKYDADAQLQAVKLRTEAAKLASQANQEDAKAAKETAQYNAAEAEMQQRFAQQETKLLPVAQQLAQAKSHEADLVQRLAALDEKSLTFRQDRLKTEGQILAVKQEISTLEERDSREAIERAVELQRVRNQRGAIALAAIEHDYNLTDNQKWEEKREILRRVVSEQEAYVANMRKLANDPSISQSARDKAGSAANSGQGAMIGAQEQLGGMGPNPNSFIENLSASIANLRSQWGSLQQNMARGFSGTINSGFNSLSSNLSKVVLQTQTLGQAFRNVAADVGITLVQAFVDMGVKWIANKIMIATVGKAIAAAETAALIPLAVAQSAIWATPATLATIASFGGAAAQAPLSIALAIGAGKAMSIAGFKNGGWTGSGGDDDYAGPAHKNEFVWSAPAVRAIGVGNLERAHQAAIAGGGGVSVAGGSSGAPNTIILALSPEDVARATRRHTDARVQRLTGRIPTARYAA